MSGPRLKNRRKICRRPGRLSKSSREVPGARAALQKPAENLPSPRPPVKVFSRSTRCPGRTSKTGGKFAVAPAAYQNSLAKEPVPGPRLKNRRKICRRPGRLPKFSREGAGARAALQKPAENLPSPRPPGWFNVRHFSITLLERSCNPYRLDTRLFPGTCELLIFSREELSQFGVVTGPCSRISPLTVKIELL